MPACHYQRSLPVCRWRQSRTDPAEGEQQTKENDAGREGERGTKQEIGIHVWLVPCQARSWGDGCVSVSVHHSVLHRHISITVGWADMKFCATALHREKRLLAAERFPSTTFPNQKKKKKKKKKYFQFFTQGFRRAALLYLLSKPYLNLQNVSFCSQPSAKVQGFIFLLKLVPCWTFHMFQQEKEK